MFFCFKNKNTATHLNFFHKLGIITNFYQLKKKFISYVRFFNNTYPYKNIKLISKYNHPFWVKHHQLKVINKYVGNSLYILATPTSLLTHKQALNKKIGGKILYFFY